MNGNRPRVILYGDSLILAGVRANLEARPDFEILVLDRPLDSPLEELHRLCPAAVVFNLGASRPDFLFPLLQQPGLLLIGVDPETHQAQVWSGMQVAAASDDDLIELVSRTLNWGPGGQGLELDQVQPVVAPGMPAHG